MFATKFGISQEFWCTELSPLSLPYWGTRVLVNPHKKGFLAGIDQSCKKFSLNHVCSNLPATHNITSTKGGSVKLNSQLRERNFGSYHIPYIHF